MADARHDYRTVLHYAILGGDPTVIDLLLKQGARLDLGPEYQKPTALDLAILKGDPSIVQMLLESGKFARSCLSLIINTTCLYIHTYIHTCHAYLVYINSFKVFNFKPTTDRD